LFGRILDSKIAWLIESIEIYPNANSDFININTSKLDVINEVIGRFQNELTERLETVDGVNEKIGLIDADNSLASELSDLRALTSPLHASLNEVVGSIHNLKAEIQTEVAQQGENVLIKVEREGRKRRWFFGIIFASQILVIVLLCFLKYAPSLPRPNYYFN